MTRFDLKRFLLAVLLCTGGLCVSFAVNPSKADKAGHLEPVFWFRADHFTQLKSGDKVERWPDLSVNGHHAVQRKRSKQPTYQHNPEIDAMGRPYLRFDGRHTVLNIRSHRNINMARFYTEKTAVFVFKTSYDIETRQIIYEEGGPHRGMNLTIIDGQLHYGMHNLINEDATTPWGYVYIATPIEVDKLYVAVISYDFNNRNFRGYLNGRYLASIDKIGRLFRHPAGIGIGGSNLGVLTHDGYVNNHGTMCFKGRFYEMLYYDNAFNESQSHLIQSYLSTKYDIELIDQSAAIDASIGRGGDQAPD